MTDVVNLEQLNYRDQMIKEYIDQHSGGGGSSESLFCELEVDTIYTDEEGEPDESHLYIKCYKNTILESDELQFARNTATPTWHYTGKETEFGNPEKILVKKRRGWIIPKPYNYVNLYKVYDEEKSSSSELFDYWEILPKNRNGEEVSWQELLDEFLEKRFQFHLDKGIGIDGSNNQVWCGDSFTNNYASFVNRWCGAAIKRNGKLISDYMKWQISGPDQKSGCLVSPYQVDGRYFCPQGSRVSAFYHFSLEH